MTTYQKKRWVMTDECEQEEEEEVPTNQIDFLKCGGIRVL